MKIIKLGKESEFYFKCRNCNTEFVDNGIIEFIKYDDGKCGGGYESHYSYCPVCSCRCFSTEKYNEFKYNKETENNEFATKKWVSEYFEEHFVEMLNKCMGGTGGGYP